MSGSDIYEIAVRIKAMPEPRWKAVVKACAGKIDSVVELLAGRFDENVMAHVCRQGTGLFPAPALAFTFAVRNPFARRDPTIGAFSKTVASVSIALWLTVAIAGRWIGFS